MKPYALGIVGTGAIGAMHVQTALGAPDVRLAAVCDERPDVLEPMAARSGARGYLRYEELAYEERLDGVIICTPPVTHRELVNFYLERGVDVLCEKPLAMNGLEAREMYACARRNGRLLMLASKFRYVADLAAARQLLREGALGTIRHAEITFTSNVDMRSRWNANPAVSGGGVVIDNGSHAADICRYLFGPVVSVAAVGYVRAEGLAVEDSAYLYLGTATGSGVTVDLSWSLERHLPYYVRIFGEHGRLSIGWKESTLSRGPSGHATTIGLGYSKAEAFVALHRDFVEASSAGGRPRMDDAAALAAVDVVEAAYASIRHGGRTAVEAEEGIAV
ncbi:MAG TPA: Gfo/Idh/MocA family oxidoreductase [Candidatus Dormibacteraeota bacterium]|nr:Gfo/Idh/MocA family oxidoreductase [Candidatus Dormibacteraeota bacterium]